MDIDTRHVQTVIVGAGQSGLATAHHLRRLGVECVLVDGHARVGDQWRERYDSLLLNSPAYRDGLPGRPFPAPKWSYPRGRDMADYLEAYAEGMDLLLGTTVTSVERREDGGFRVDCGDTVLLADAVVIATGGERNPRVPEVAGALDPGIRQLHASQYRAPDQLLPGPVLIVGAGQSGADLALEAAAAGHETWLSGPIRKEVPVDIGTLGFRRIFPVLWFVWNHVLTTATPVGRRAQPKVRNGAAPLVRVKSKHLRAAGVRHLPAHTTATTDGLPTLEDGTVVEAANVLWCTGYRQDFSVLRMSVTGPDGWPTDVNGVMRDLPGLYFMGLLFQRGFYSMLIGGVGRDAERIAAHIAGYVRGTSSPRLTWSPPSSAAAPS
ncbi:putative flavoprotein involved in K+ transport [Nocardioides terrae]|uniref:Putative flavoprotein involved in K+ transport n=1 Tax=Nocardioides terrae TaxID=574651 RepID=A0A1I1FQT7_9ACTN|nr:NAD(P)/FAD-dependent oxidoreductase [Nocardioides terrae]SFB99453.1 putative flavoprotein involved in K+ transport [Nocardioides terrae]